MDPDLHSGSRSPSPALLLKVGSHGIDHHCPFEQEKEKILSFQALRDSEASSVVQREIKEETNSVVTKQCLVWLSQEGR